MVHPVFEDLDIVIVGGGICGLATALALHRKGMKSVVLEKSEVLRASGGAIAIQPNGWRALDELGVASKLRTNGILLERIHEIYLNGGKPKDKFVDYSNIGETRWVKRSDLIESLAQDLPLGTVRVGCQICSVKIDANTSFPTLQLNDGTIIRAKMLIGCDGANSVVADFLELNPKKLHPSSGVRGFTYFPNGHGFAPELLRTIRDKTMAGVAPVNDNLLFWFVNHQYNYQDSKMLEDPKKIKQMVLETIKGYPQKTTDVIQNCDISSLSFNRLRYRAPWDILLGQYRRGTVTVAGDSMHAMTPFVGQGGSASIEDAVVLARCMARKFPANYNNDHKDFKSKKMIEEAIDEYVNERRMRLVKLALQSYLLGTLVDTPYLLVKLIMLVLLSAFFRDRYAHVRYNCGNL
ncbi:monooxygenase 1-like [Pistacia vera]|uniref:monooxygenase 1-like n=1 Tax=Pistacia vera TaxID=55513 RepID=UPI0012637DA4|nr:monooxygenase 1-like [Pistacia vera]